MTARKTDAMPRAGSAGYARLGGQAVFDALGVEGMKAKGAKAKDLYVKGGQAQGKINTENGCFGGYGAPGSIRTLEGSRRGGIRQCHIRWHVARNKPNFKRCELCRAELTQLEKAA